MPLLTAAAVLGTSVFPAAQDAEKMSNYHYQLALLAPDLLNLRGWGELARELGTVPRALSAGETTGAQKGEVNCPKPWDPKLGLEAFRVRPSLPPGSPKE